MMYLHDQRNSCLHSWRSTQGAVRPAFTLLEVILAISLSVVLLIALYLTLSIHYRHAQAGRELINETVIIRSVVTRISQDIACQLSASDPRLAASPAPAASDSSADSASATSKLADTGAAASGTPAAPVSANTSGSSPSTSTMTSSTNNTVLFNLGVYGDANSLVLTGKGVPKDLTQPLQSNPTLTCDLRRITYWVDGERGLARFELSRVTGEEASTIPPPMPPRVDDLEPYIIAPEIKKISLEYFDGSDWRTSWDGTTPDAQTGRPMGPPLAIAVTFTLALPGQRQAPSAERAARTVTYRHVAAIPAANNLARSNAQAP